MSDALKKILSHQGFAVLDGALATELEQKGADLHDPLWSAKCLLEAPALIAEVHHDYLQAGADVISSATYQASEAGFKARGLGSKQARALMQQGVALAVQVRDEYWSPGNGAAAGQAVRHKPLVAVSMGPFGACLHDGSEYHGNYDAGWREVSIFHRERMLLLAEAGADLLAFETIPSLPEAEIIVELLEKYSGDLHGLESWISFSCKDDMHVSHGESFREAMELLASSAQLAAGGVNCSAPAHIAGLLRSTQGLDLPWVVYPNSGETWISQQNCWVGQGGTDFTIAEWFGLGARLLGGCCRTRPNDIAAIRSTLAGLGKTSA
jgi:homocysteine S-methyltransferase